MEKRWEVEWCGVVTWLGELCEVVLRGLQQAGEHHALVVGQSRLVEEKKLDRELLDVLSV